jgi:hypothetical protein
MSFERRVSEPKASKCGTFTSRTVKVGNKLLGTIETPKLKAGERPEATYWATDAVVRVTQAGRFLSVSRPNLAGLRTYAVKRVGLRCADGAVYQIPFEKVTAILGEVKSGAFVSISVDQWEVDMPPEAERMMNTMALMRIPGGRKVKDGLF